MSSPEQAVTDPSAWSAEQWQEQAQSMQGAALQVRQEVVARLSPWAPWGAEPPSAEQIRHHYDTARQSLIDSQYRQAALEFTTLAAHRPNEPRFLFGLGLAMQMLGEPELALDTYTSAYNLDPRDAACLLRVGECLRALGRDAEARQAWLAALKLCSLPHNATELRGLIQAALDRL